MWQSAWNPAEDDNFEVFVELEEFLGFVDYPRNIPPIRAEALGQRYYTFGDTLRKTEFYALPNSPLTNLPNKISYKFFPINQDETLLEESGQAVPDTQPNFVNYSEEKTETSVVIKTDLSQVVLDKQNIFNSIYNDSRRNFAYNETNIQTSQNINITHQENKSVENNYNSDVINTSINNSASSQINHNSVFNNESIIENPQEIKNIISKNNVVNNQHNEVYHENQSDFVINNETTIQTPQEVKNTIHENKSVENQYNELHQGDENKIFNYDETVIQMPQEVKNIVSENNVVENNYNSNINNENITKNTTNQHNESSNFIYGESVIETPKFVKNIISEHNVVEEQSVTEINNQQVVNNRRKQNNKRINNVNIFDKETLVEDIEQNDTNYIRTAEHRINTVINKIIDKETDNIKESVVEHIYEKPAPVLDKKPSVKHKYSESVVPQDDMDFKLHKHMVDVESKIEAKIEASNREQENKVKKLLSKFEKELLG